MFWQKRTDVPLYDEKDFDKLFHLRVNYASDPFTSDSIRKYLDHMHLVQQDYLKRFMNHKAVFLEMLEGTRRGWMIEHKVTPSPAKTIAEVLLTFIVQPYLTSALRLYREQNIPLFLMDVDFSFGIVEIPAAIMGAATEGEGGGKEAVDYGLLSELKHTGPVPSRITDQLSNELLKACHYHRKLFLKDPTGETLLSSILSCMEADDASHSEEPYHCKIPSYHNKTLYIAGSKFGKNAYKGLYNLWKEKNFSYELS